MNIVRIFRNTFVLSINTLYAPIIFGVLIVGAMTISELVGLSDGPLYELEAVLLSLFWSVSCLHVAGTAARDRSINLFESFCVGLFRIPSFLAAVLVLALMTTLAGFAFVVPGFYVLCRWGLAPFLVASENIGVVEAFNRSDELTRGYLWQVFATFCLATLLSTVAQWSLIAAAFYAISTFEANFVITLVALMLSGVAFQSLFQVGAVALAHELERAH